MTFDINDFIKQYNLESKKDQLSSFKIDKVLYYRSKDETLIKVHNATVLPYDVYNALKDYLKTLINHDVRMIVNTDSDEISLLEISQYLRGYSNGHKSLFKLAMPIIKDETLTIFYEEKKSYDGDKEYFDDLKLYFASIGYRAELNFSYQEGKRGDEEVRVAIRKKKKR